MGGGGTPFLATNLGCLPTSVALSREEGAQSITWHGGEETSTYPASQSREDPHATHVFLGQRAAPPSHTFHLGSRLEAGQVASVAFLSEKAGFGQLKAATLHASDGHSRWIKCRVIK